MTRLLTLLTTLLVLALAPAAQAAWFGAEPIDGPAEIDALGDVDVARDGTGAVVYLKREGGVPQVFLSRLTGGVWSAPVKISSGPAVSEAAVSATDGGRLMVAWIAGGTVLGTVIERAGAAPAPVATLGGPGATGLGVDMGINEAGYAVWSAGGDVRAARLDENVTWTPIASALDVDPARSAGTGPSRPRVGVSAEGNAVVVWGENAANGTTRVMSRRLTGLNLSVAPQDLTLPAFEGGAGGNADSPDIDIEDDGSFAWVAFRQDIGGRSRTVARRLRGSAFEDAFAIDAGQTSFSPRIDFAGKGLGGAVTAAAGDAVFSGYLDKFDAFQPAVRIDETPGGQPSPVIATSERGDVYAAWRTGPGEVRARRKDGEKGFEPEFAASNPALGPVAPGQIGIGADRSGNTAVAMLQGAGAARTVSVAVYDRLPGRPVVLSSSRYRARRPLIKWAVGSENWGAQKFTVYVDKKVVGTTTNRNRLVSKRRLGRGLHRYRVRATDRRGQVSTSRTRSFRVDPGLPVLALTVRRRGRTVTVSTVARDRGPSGLDFVQIDWGDKSRKLRRRSAVHHYKKGRYTLTVRAVDKAANVTAKKKVLRIP
jgi:hypothetical protein